jgi:transposase InsO family protein
MMISEVSDGKACIYPRVQARGSQAGAGTRHDGGAGVEGPGPSRQRVAQVVEGREGERRRRLPFDHGVRPEHAIAPNLLDRQFEATAPNQRWVADCTYIWTNEGWLYFAVALDLLSRRIVGSR